MVLYFVETPASGQRALLCRHADRLFSEGGRVQIVVDSTSAAQFIDQMLWTFSQSSFVPHAVAGPERGDTPYEPVMIVIGEKRLEGFNALLCDASVSLDFMCRFETAIHFVLLDDAEKKQESRLLWQEARKLGIDPVHVPYVKAVGPQVS